MYIYIYVRIYIYIYRYTHVITCIYMYIFTSWKGSTMICLQIHILGELPQSCLFFGIRLVWIIKKNTSVLGDHPCFRRKHCLILQVP